MSKRHFLGRHVAAVAVAIVFVVGWQALAQQDVSTDSSRKQKMSMRCPMMESMKDVEVYSDSPVLLLAQAENLDLTEQQKEQIRKAAKDARRQARDVLDPTQQEKLAKAPEGKLSLHQIASLLGEGKDQSNVQNGQMCPMCMRMMKQQKRQNTRGENGDRQPSHDTETSEN